MKKFLAFLIFIAMAGGSTAAPVLVKGSVTQGEGLFIRLRTYADLVSNLEVTLASTEIGQNGRFELKADIDEITWAFLEIDLQRADIYLQPGEIYEVMVENEAGSLLNTFYDRPSLLVEFITDDKDDLNRRIGEVNELFNDIMIKDLPQATLNNETKQLPVLFSGQAGQKAGPKAPDYLREYIRYRSAGLEYALQVKGRNTLIREYMSSVPLPYSHVEFMEFFNLLFEKYLLSNNRYISYSMIFDLVNGGKGLKAVMDTLKRDPLLNTADLAELVLLSGLKEFHSTAGFKKDKVAELVAEMALSASTPEARTIAGNLLRKFNRLGTGTPAPEWSLTDRQGSPLSLAGFKGKYLYLGFLMPGQTVSDSQLDTLQVLYLEFSPKIEFISLLHVTEPSGAVTGLYERLPWPVGILPRDPEILESYDVKTFPHYILIDPEGRIYRSPAPGPAENVRRLLEGI